MGGKFARVLDARALESFFLLGQFGDLLSIQEKGFPVLNLGFKISNDQTDFPGVQSSWLSLSTWDHSMIFLWDLLPVAPEESGV